jgi:hypothetical protein
MQKPVLTVLSLIGLFALPIPAFAATDAECQKTFEAADSNRDGVLTDAEGSRYFAAMRAANKQVTGDRLERAAFMEHCKSDVFAASQAQPSAGAPLEGANSFTEGQAKERAMDAGFTDVSALQKDDKGIWRGTAKRGGTQVNIAIDFKGNVVAQ